MAVPRLSPLFAVAVATLGIAAPATAQTAPADSAFDQYLESVPGPRGEETPPLRGQGVELPTAAQESLQQAGPVGERAATLAATTSKRSPGASERDRRSDGETGIGGVLGSVLDPVPGGMGVLLPVILVVTALLGAAHYLGQRRSAAPEAG